MKIREFLKEYFQKRLERFGCLTVYDPEQRYRDLLMELDGDICRVIDGSRSTILAREEAMETWQRLGDSSGSLQSMLVYLPIPKPRTEVERQRNPYEAFTVGGGVFPYSDGDSYQALCRRAKVDFQHQVDQLFAAGVPDFDTVDAIDSGANWPKLRSLLKAESAAEILVALLSPTDAQRQALEADDAWPGEFRPFAQTTLGLKLKTKSRKWSPIRQELGRYLLFSEFVLDLPEELPEELKDVPRGDVSRLDLINAVCETLRTSPKHENAYIEMANGVNADLRLEERLKHVKDFGQRDIFAFEERTFLL